MNSYREHPPGRAIDIGCGTGTNVITLARAGWQVTGVDFAPRAISLARKKLKKAGIQADSASMTRPRFQGIRGPFDLRFRPGLFSQHSCPWRAAKISGSIGAHPGPGRILANVRFLKARTRLNRIRA
jgi:SAM-dependent methyltransferase